jgi:pimeloyl-ACP methyl ester carboxylesterase
MKSPHISRTGTLMTVLIASVLISCNKMPTTDLSKASANPVSVKQETAVDAKTNYVEVNGRKIAYRSIGKGTPFILCNRFRGTLDTWDPAFLDALAKDFNVITFDPSGLGLSTGTPSVEMQQFAADIKDLADGLGFTSIIAGGWSFGGMVAQTAIVRYPSLISHGVLIGTNPPGKNEHPIEPVFFERSRIFNYNLDDETVLFFEPAWPESRIAARQSHDRIAGRTADLDVMIPEHLWANYNEGVMDFVTDKMGVREKIITSKIPLLVIMGDHDICFPVQNWYALVRKLETTQLVVFPKAGHGPQHEFPEVTSSYIRIFVENFRTRSAST